MIVTLDHVHREDRIVNEPYISHDIQGSVIFIDCDILTSRSSSRQSFVWSIGFDRKTNEILYNDNKMKRISCEEFVALVERETPQYLTPLLFLLPNPASYFRDFK